LSVGDFAPCLEHILLLIGDIIEHNRRLRISVILCAVLTFILGIVAIYIFRQRRRLARSSRMAHSPTTVDPVSSTSPPY
ncbi:MAG: hypothetical protein K2L80_07275, partial [Muribaculaceae bacterium]|nr:hypothetical protein [Muribaculaceae bacterium]